MKQAAKLETQAPDVSGEEGEEEKKKKVEGVCLVYQLVFEGFEGRKVAGT